MVHWVVGALLNKQYIMEVMTQHNALARMNEKVRELRSSSPPHNIGGRGVVICAGGMKYFACAWVCINMLRRRGCQLPVELWHLGPGELSEKMRCILSPLKVCCVDAHSVAETHPSRILNGWELKPYAIIHSTFREVLLLDADNMAVRDPTFLFDEPAYRRTGAIFWPDYNRLSRRRAIWDLTGVPYRDEPEFETGQIIVDKVKCWKPLQLSMWMNEYSDFWYRHIHGDKETFHMAWRKLDQEYAMPSKGIYPLQGTMCQHDFAGDRLFQHRNLAKWSCGRNQIVPGFEYQDECFESINMLKNISREVFGLKRYSENGKNSRELDFAKQLISRRWLYERVGFDCRGMRFNVDGTIGEGCARLEQVWNIEEVEAQVVLDLQSDDSLTCRLKWEDGRWSGRWTQYERMPVLLRPDLSLTT